MAQNSSRGRMVRAMEKPCQVTARFARYALRADGFAEVNRNIYTSIASVTPLVMLRRHKWYAMAACNKAARVQ